MIKRNRRETGTGKDLHTKGESPLDLRKRPDGVGKKITPGEGKLKWAAREKHVRFPTRRRDESWDRKGAAGEKWAEKEEIGNTGMRLTF